MQKVVIPAAYFIRKDTAPHKIGVDYPPEYEPQVQAIIKAAESKGIKQLAWEIKLPYRPRSKGPRSQNSRIHGHCKDIADQLGDYTVEEVKDAMKRMAVSEGYPTKYSLDGREVPKSSSQASVEEAKLLCDVIQRFADEHNLYLTEYDEDGPYKSIGGRTREDMRRYYEQK